ncbi:hypothetical protein LSH36_807g00071 [Paralvinella palmiformis]|uniref:Uncharacterized protein n=1 Tax=Paralvinella palmiformis TaxID=53620 RepID=A0AAD9MU21_9ANNE|nr:hypothetical protein LSH36_807g00071 [Paralvinella palmiformis]
MDTFGEKIHVTGEVVAPGMTGDFEVEIVGRKVLHSKKNGHGFVDSDKKLKRIMKGIEAALSS